MLTPWTSSYFSSINVDNVSMKDFTKEVTALEETKIDLSNKDRIFSNSSKVE